MVQILPENVTPTQQILRGLNTGLSGLTEMFMKEKLQDRQMKRLTDVLGMGTAQPVMETPSEISEQVEIKTQQASNLEKIATNPQAMLLLSQQNPQMANQIQKMYDAQLQREKFEFEKHKQKLKESPITSEMKQRMSTALESQLELLKTGDIGLGQYHKLLTEKGRENRAEFDTYRASIESVLLPLLNKGVLSKPRFEFILKNIPSSRDTIGKIKGKIKALNKEFGLNLKEPSLSKQKTNELTKDMAQKFLKATQGDKNKAREMAKKSGFNF